jgi:Bacterial Ig-like domain
MKYGLIFTLLFLVSCATPGTLGGGPQDEQAPAIVATDLSETNFKSKRITLEFEEYVAFNNPEKNILLIPAHSKMKFTISKKKAIITFDTILRENTTYSLIINKGIQDVNASNPLVHSMVFSTGPFRDSGSILVRIPNYKDYKSLKLALTESDGSDSFKHFNPAYLFDVMDENIKFSGLNTAKRNLWLFTDLNSDNKPDFYKPAGLYRDVQTDSAYALSAVEWLRPFTIQRSIQDSLFLKLFYTPLADHEKSLSSLTGISQDRFVYTTGDSAVIFLSPDIDFKNLNIQRTDTVSDLQIRKEVRNMVATSIRLIKHKSAFQLYYTLPLYYNDSAVYQYSSNRSASFKTKPDSFILNRYDPATSSIQFRDTFYLKSTATEEVSKLTHLDIKISDTAHLFYDLKLTKEGKIYSFQSGVKSFELYMEPGTYLLQIYPYKSRYIFNPFEMVESALPIYEKTLYLKASWEEILTVKL